MRFGLLGTGYWAAETHAAALVAAPDATLVAVWGRDPAKAALLADRYGIRAYEDVDELLADVDAVAIALPPDVQAPLAARAARAGKHLFLDKPLALTRRRPPTRWWPRPMPTRGRSVVFFTSRFTPGGRSSSSTGRVATGGWDGGRATILGSVAGRPVRRLAVAARARRPLGRRAARAVAAAPGPRAGRPGVGRGRDRTRRRRCCSTHESRRGQHDDAEPGLAGLDLGRLVLRLGRLGPVPSADAGREDAAVRALAALAAGDRPATSTSPATWSRSWRPPRTPRSAAERPGPGVRPDGRVHPVQLPGRRKPWSGECRFP